MGKTITVRIGAEMADWLARSSTETGVPVGGIVRGELERAMSSARGGAFMRLAGVVAGPADLSSRKGFARPSAGGRARRRA